jgi:hypothetical protein
MDNANTENETVDKIIEYPLTNLFLERKANELLCRINQTLDKL